MKIYNKNHLLKQLKAAGLPASKKKVIEYEKKGVIERGSIELIGGVVDWRYYTEEDINKNIERMRDHVEKRDAENKLKRQARQSA